ncbi:hypothetical protein AX16_005106 [Volvariella volvacea WC 439]|nr:hypothetical protein AX16_005106 [Volvariella volvacea WC 439]
MHNTETPQQPRLPPELEHVIFRMAALGRRCRLPVLMRVARRVRHWLEPLLFEIVVLPDSDSACYFDNGTTKLYCDLRRYPSGPQKLHVKSLMVEDLRGEFGPSWAEFVPKCYNLQNVALWYHHTPRNANVLADLTMIVRSPSRTVCGGLRRLSAMLAHLFPGGEVDFNHEVLRDLTHLQVLDHLGTNCLKEWREGNNFGCLRKLRYLYFEAYFPVETVKRCLESCEALELVAVHEAWGMYMGPPEAGPKNGIPEMRRKVRPDGTVEEVREDRVVMLRMLPAGMWITDWIKDAAGEDCMWTEAERAIEMYREKTRSSE